MKGVILDCLKTMVVGKFGQDKWQDITASAGLKPGEMILATVDVEDKTAMNLIGSTCKVLNITLEQAALAFGEHWMNAYASKIYAGYTMNVKSTKELLLKLDSIHDKVTKNMPNARPPKFTYEWKSDKVLIMTYNSPRNLIDLFVGLAKSVANFFNEKATVKKLSNTQVEISFA